ncbi:hypothetical protein HNV28_15150 [Myxococcus xanthus]|uniref:Lipoprotein n=2 Tax=Myxococcus xanthus TaxID=34 RepID=A0A7Y4IJC8_MYXXA|nr:hypothetical protein [Myxococcus xanthus]NOJ79660.1 hypothetical protein [Myxococcus xanthus]NOJ85918.1 hypothetical protein [Myxococcus xanthus]
MCAVLPHGVPAMMSPRSFRALACTGALSLLGAFPVWAAPIESPGPREIARIGTSDSHVLWLEGEGGAVNVAVIAQYPQRPLVAPRFFQTHSAAEVFLAVAPEGHALPPALADHALVAMDEGERAQLRRQNEAELSALPTTFPDEPRSLTGSCSASNRAWAASVYGDPTCGDPSQEVIHTAFTSDSYCNSPDCDFPLGSEDGYQCSPQLLACDRVRGTATRVRLRATHWNGALSFNHPGHSMHFAVLNCAGNGPVTFNFSRGTGADSLQLNPGQMGNVKLGAHIAPAVAAKRVTMGRWTEGLPASGDSYVSNAMSVADNSGTADAVLACGDIITRYTMSDLTVPACHNYADLALCNGTNCSNACYYTW